MNFWILFIYIFINFYKIFGLSELNCLILLPDFVNNLPLTIILKCKCPFFQSFYFIDLTSLSVVIFGGVEGCGNGEEWRTFYGEFSSSEPPFSVFLYRQFIRLLTYEGRQDLIKIIASVPYCHTSPLHSKDPVSDPQKPQNPQKKLNPKIKFSRK